MSPVQPNMPSKKITKNDWLLISIYPQTCVKNKHNNRFPFPNNFLSIQPNRPILSRNLKSIDFFHPHTNPIHLSASKDNALNRTILSHILGHSSFGERSIKIVFGTKTPTPCIYSNSHACEAVIEFHVHKRLPDSPPIVLQ